MRNIISLNITFQKLHHESITLHVCVTVPNWLQITILYSHHCMYIECIYYGYRVYNRYILHIPFSIIHMNGYTKFKLLYPTPTTTGVVPRYIVYTFKLY